VAKKRKTHLQKEQEKSLRKKRAEKKKEQEKDEAARIKERDFITDDDGSEIDMG